MQETGTDAEDRAFERTMRAREVALAEQRLAHDMSAGRPREAWASPLVVAVFAAAVAAAGNAVVTYVEGNLDRELEVTKAEHARIQEMLATGDADAAADNLQFLVDVGLITDPGLRDSLTAFLDQREAGEGPVLAPSVPIAPVAKASGRVDVSALDAALNRWGGCGSHNLQLRDDRLDAFTRTCLGKYLGASPEETQQALDQDLGALIRWIETGPNPPADWRAQLGL